MRHLKVGLLLFVSLACVARATEVRQTPPSTKQRLERAARGLTHFATGGLIANWWSDARRWPVGMLEAQDNLLQQLRIVSADRDGLRGLLGDRDPKIRTLALGALFIREDPQDLPFIARLMNDRAVTIRRLGSSATSNLGPLPLSMFESRQTVGGVAHEMIRFYLLATDRWGLQLQRSAFNLEPDNVAPLFETYWTERSTRTRCVSWFLVKMRRATRQISALGREYEGDVRRVLAEIDALPAVERAWTLLFVRTDQRQIDTLVSDAALVNALRAVGPDGLMTFLRREPPTDDPDVLAGSVYSGSRTGFILDHAPQLLRARDADAVVAAAEAYRTLDNNTRFVAAAARMRALEDVDGAAASLRVDIQRIPITRILGSGDQAVLAFSLWQIRGATERTFLANWLYDALPYPRALSDLESFFRSVEREARPDTSLLLSAIVNDVRFEQMEWSPMARMLEMVNQTLPAPLVDRDTIYDHMPGSARPDQQETLATWRRLLRQHFGVAQ